MESILNFFRVYKLLIIFLLLNSERNFALCSFLIHLYAGMRIQKKILGSESGSAEKKIRIRPSFEMNKKYIYTLGR